MATVGQILKEKRVHLNLTIDDIQEKTNISGKHIEALENDEYRTIPGDAYVKGFINLYAKVVGLDGAVLVGQYKREQSGEEIDKKNQLNIDSKKVLGRDLETKQRSLWLLIAVFAAIAIGAFAYFGWLRSTPEAKTPKPKAVKTPEKKDIETEPDIQQPLELKLKITVVDTDCWMEIISDGKQVFVGTIKTGESKTITAMDNIYLYAASGRRVVATFNGEDLGTLNTTGETVSLTFTHQGINQGEVSKDEPQ